MDKYYKDDDFFKVLKYIYEYASIYTITCFKRYQAGWMYKLKQGIVDTAEYFKIWS